jgi:hypothetical protein
MTVADFCKLTGKRCYRSRSEATEANHGINRRKGARGRLSAYLCRACGAWHLGRERA